MERRTAIKMLGAIGAAGLPGGLRAAPEPEAQKVDVLVVGGGTAGVVAALQAARAGARTQLVEMGGQLGGTMTVGGVNWPALFNAWGKPVIAGIGWELVTRAVELDGGKFPDLSVPNEVHGGHAVGVNGQLYAAVAEEACLEIGVVLRYYEFPLSVRAADDGWQVDLAGKGVRRQIHCRQLIDCTGGADIVGMIGLPRLRDAETQPGTLIFSLTGYSTGALDAKAIETRYREALRDGRLQEGDYCYAGRPFLDFLKRGGANQQHIFGADGSTSETKTAANIAGRASVLRLLRFVRSLPGCSGAKLAKMQTETAVRETFRIVGETMVTQADFTAGRVYEDAVGFTFYPIDIHDRHGVEPQKLKPGIVPTLPLREIGRASCRESV